MRGRRSQATKAVGRELPRTRFVNLVPSLHFCACGLAGISSQCGSPTTSPIALIPGEAVLCLDVTEGCQISCLSWAIKPLWVPNLQSLVVLGSVQRWVLCGARHWGLWERASHAWAPRRVINPFSFELLPCTRGISQAICFLSTAFLPSADVKVP